jgi:glyoxylase-like metal-dependent hydrolase (beta-lactamase superfamily II)
LKKPVQLENNIFLIDAMDLGMEERTGTYVLTETDLTIIETSASPSVPYILEGLRNLNLSPEDIKYIIVTHIHLDHAGGAGLLLEHCPNAKIVVHERGARHLANPERLIAGAKAVYGDKFDALFDPIVPVPEDKLIIKKDKETLSISENCTLTFYDTPGHANHHFSIHHSRVNGMFTGDTAGIFYQDLYKDGIEFYLPSTSPNQFDPEKMLASVKLFENMDLRYIFFSHYGASKNPNEVYKQVRYWLSVFVEEAKQAFEQEETTEMQVRETEARLRKRVTQYLEEKNIPSTHPVFKILSLDFSICAMGLIDYLKKQ